MTYPDFRSNSVFRRVLEKFQEKEIRKLPEDLLDRLFYRDYDDSDGFGFTEEGWHE